MGYNNERIFNLSQSIISAEANCYFGEAYNISYTDVYDFSSKKQSLKKWEIELGIHHEEWAYPWDEPIPEELWDKAANYCANDVIATEVVFNHLTNDFLARQILAQMAGGTVNDTTNGLMARIIFDGTKNPQSAFRYRDLSKPVRAEEGSLSVGPRIFNAQGYPMFETYIPWEDLPEGYSIAPFFPGYIFDNGTSTYRGEVVGEGGYVFSNPGMYENVVTQDVVSMHPSSIVQEDLFGKYTHTYRLLLDARIAIKNGQYDVARELLGSKYETLLTKVESPRDLAHALKIALNSVYGLTSAKFKNPFRDPRNRDNIVAKRGALFMINLLHLLQDQGVVVIHIKTDSIKLNIVNPTPEILKYISDYGREFGYIFETESEFEKLCLVNDAVYIGKERDGTWKAVGKQFQIPYVFKTLFTREKLIFDDVCETKSVTTALYLDFNESLPEGEHNYKFVGRVGRFCPVIEGCGGGVLLRKSKTGEYHSAEGAKGYRWIEAERLRHSKWEEMVDFTYYKRLAEEAIQAIAEYGDPDWFRE